VEAHYGGIFGVKNVMFIEVHIIQFSQGKINHLYISHQSKIIIGF
jgi:hypothetical protein